MEGMGRYSSARLVGEERLRDANMSSAKNDDSCSQGRASAVLVSLFHFYATAPLDSGF